MTFEEKGAYIELLMMQFNRGHMTSHMIGQTVGQLWDKLKCKFVQDEEGNYYNVRLEQEKEKRQKYCNSRENNKEGKNQYTGKEGHMTSHTSSHMTGHTEGHMEDVNENVNKTKNKPRKSNNTTLETIDMNICNQVTESWNRIVKSLPSVKPVGTKRLKAIMELYKFTECLDDIEYGFSKVEESDYLKGNVKDWKASFNWVIEIDNWQKVSEGTYSGNSNKKLVTGFDKIMQIVNNHKEDEAL